MEDYNQIIFCNYVWETLANQNPETVTVFINIMLELNQKYQESGGTYPSIEFVLGMAKDTINSRNKESEEEIEQESEQESEEEIEEEIEESEEEIEESLEEKNDRVREARLLFYEK
jgi:CBS domain containing-hemolysin-like protein